MHTKHIFLNYFVLPLVGVILFTSCSSRPEPQPYSYQQEKTTDKFIPIAKTVTLYSQELELPKELLVPSTVAINEPYVKVLFDKPTYILKLLIYQTQEIIDEDGEKVELYPRSYAIQIDDNNESEFNPTYFYDAQTLVEIDEINISSTTPHKSLSFTLSDFIKKEKNSKLRIQKYPTLKIDGYVVEDLVFNALSTREDKVLNEALVQEIAREDEALFRNIQKNPQAFNLPSNSLAQLPQDVDLRYALKNHKKILKANRYKSTDGTYKRVQEQKNFDSNYTYKSSHKVKISGKKVKVKSTAKKHKVAEYIDFSEGL